MNDEQATAKARSGKAFYRLMMLPLAIYFLIVLALLIADVLYVGPTVTSWWPPTLSWEGPVRLWQTIKSPEILFALKLSLLTSTVSVLLSMIIAIPAGYVLSRRKFFGRTVIDTLVDIPIVLPPLVVGLSLLVLFRPPFGTFLEKWGIELAFRPAGIVAAQFIVACAFGIRTMKATFDGIDPRYEGVCRTLGFGPFRAFLKGTLPLSRSGIVAAVVITWARAVGEFGPILVFCGVTRFRTEVLPTSIFLEVSVGNLHGALSVALLMIAMAIVVLTVLKKVGGRIYLA